MPAGLSAEPAFLFVYGTLRRGYPGPMARLLARNARFAGRARCRGRLHDLGTYPALTAGRGCVRGDLFRLAPGTGLLARLDVYEDCGGVDPEYRRERISVARPGGTVEEAWAYVYQRNLEGRPKIRGGDFCRELKKRRSVKKNLQTVRANIRIFSYDVADPV